MLAYVVLIVGCLSGTLFLALQYKGRRQSKLSLPPGPAPAFFVGNALQIPSTQSWIWYGTELKQKFGMLSYIDCMVRSFFRLTIFSVKVISST
jgi:hypothetical protein